MSNDPVCRRVLFIIPTLHGGGAERVVLTLLRHFDRSRLRVQLAVVDMRDAAYRDLVPADVPLVDLGCQRVLYALPRIVRLVRALQPDVVFSTLGHLNLALACVRSMFPRRTRLIARETMVVSEYLCEFKRPRLWAWLYRNMYGRVDRLVCQSHDMRDDLVRNFGFPAAKTCIIHNPVDLVEVRSRAEEPLPAGYPASPAGYLRLVAAGRLAEQKGFDLLLDAVEASPDLPLHLDILGEGPLRERLQARIERAGLQERVCLAGFQSNPYPWIRRADAFVLSSRYEGFSNAVLESLACGTPVLALPCPGGVREALALQPGCLIAREMSAQALAEIIRQWRDGGVVRVEPDATAPYAVGTIVRIYEELLHEESFR